MQSLSFLYLEISSGTFSPIAEHIRKRGVYGANSLKGYDEQPVSLLKSLAK